MEANRRPGPQYRVTCYGQHVGDLTAAEGGWKFTPVAPGYLPSSFVWPTPEAAARECAGFAAVVEIAP